MKLLALALVGSLTACGSGSNPGDDDDDDAPDDATGGPDANEIAVWPTGAIQTYATGTVHYDVAFDDRGRQLLERNLDLPRESTWTYSGDFLIESTFSIRGVLDTKYSASLVDGLPRAGELFHYQSSGELSYTEQETWDWDTTGALPALRTVRTTRQFAGSPTVSVATETYSRTAAGYDIGRCSDDAPSCSTGNFVGPVAYLGGPVPWTRLSVSSSSGTWIAADRTFDGTGQLARWERHGAPPGAEGDPYTDTWTRNGLGIPLSVVRVGYGASTTTYTFP